jgi:hypothetical protein
MNKVLIGIPTAPFLNYGEYEAAWPDNPYDKANRRWERVYGRFNGPSTERQTAVRETWWKHQAPAVCKFFMGRTATDEHKADDVVILDCGDNYLFDLQEKIQGMARWALDNDFEVMIKAGRRHLCSIQPWFPSCKKRPLITAGCIYNEYCVGGGTGEVYSRKAMEIIANAPDTVFPEHRHWEDRWFGEILARGGHQGHLHPTASPTSPTSPRPSSTPSTLSLPTVCVRHTKKFTTNVVRNATDVQVIEFYPV